MFPKVSKDFGFVANASTEVRHRSKRERRKAALVGQFTFDAISLQRFFVFDHLHFSEAAFPWSCDASFGPFSSLFRNPKCFSVLKAHDDPPILGLAKKFLVQLNNVTLLQ